MDDLRVRLESRRRALEPEPGGFERLVRRRRRRAISRRVTSGTFALIATVAITWGLVRTVGERSHATPISPDNVAHLRVKWSAKVDGRPSRPVIADGMVFVVADRLYAFAKNCTDPCSPTWTGDIGETALAPSTPVVQSGVVVARSDAGLAAFDIRCGREGATCTPLWTAPNPSIPPGDQSLPGAFSEPVAAHGSIYVGGPQGLYVFNARCVDVRRACRPTWVGSGPELGRPAIGAGAVYARRRNEIFAYPLACDRDRCPALWRANIQSVLQKLPTAGATVGSGGLYIETDARRISRDGLRLWADTGTADLGRASVAGSAVYLSAGDRVFAFPIDCGSSGDPCEPMWSGPVDVGYPSTPWTDPVVANSLVFASTDRPYAFGVGCGTDGAECRPLWAGPPEVQAATPAVSGRTLVVTYSTGKVEAFTPERRED